MEDDVGTGNTGVQRDEEFAGRSDVEVHPLLMSEARHRAAQKRLGRVRRIVRELRGRGATAGPQMQLVVDEQRRAELTRKIEQVATADGQTTIGIDRRSVGEQVPRDRTRHQPTASRCSIDSGADTPTRSSPIARPMRAASTSQSRAWVSSGATLSPMT